MITNLFLRKTKMQEHEKIFKEYVRSTAFNISLSVNQSNVLLDLYRGLSNDSSDNSYFVTGAKGLIRKGFLVHNKYPERIERFKNGEKIQIYSGTSTGQFPAYTITKAGFKVVELLLIAGIENEQV